MNFKSTSLLALTSLIVSCGAAQQSNTGTGHDSELQTWTTHNGNNVFRIQFYTGSPTTPLTDAQKSTLGIETGLTLPELSTSPATQETEAEKMCRFAGSAETYKHCKFMAIRRNHVQALANAIDDQADPQTLGGLRFTQGWFQLDKNFCAASQATGLAMSGAVKFDANLAGLTGRTRNGHSGIISTLGMASVLAGNGWKKIQTPGCSGVRPGDIIFTTDEPEWRDAPAHAFMFFGWNGMPESFASTTQENAFFESAGQQADPTHGGFKRFGMAIDNNRATARFKYFRPIAQDHMTPPGDDSPRNGCWFYMRGPTPFQGSRTNAGTGSGTGANAQIFVATAMLTPAQPGLVQFKVSAPGATAITVYVDGLSRALKEFSKNEITNNAVTFVQKFVAGARPGAVVPRKLKVVTQYADGSSKTVEQAFQVGY